MVAPKERNLLGPPWLAELALVLVVFLGRESRARACNGELGPTCEHGAGFGFRLAMEARTLDAALRTGTGSFQNVSPKIPFSVTAQRVAIVFGPSVSGVWTPARWVYVGGELSIALGPADQSDVATTEGNVQVAPGASGWTSLATIGGARMKTGPIFVGGELALGGSITGTNARITYGGRTYYHNSTSNLSWQVEPRLTLAAPSGVGNFELMVGLDLPNASRLASLMVAAGFSAYGY